MSRPAPAPEFVMTQEMAGIWDRLGVDNVYLTGRAGTGKSSTARQFHATTRLQVAVVAQRILVLVGSFGFLLVRAIRMILRYLARSIMPRCW